MRRRRVPSVVIHRRSSPARHQQGFRQCLRAADPLQNLSAGRRRPNLDAGGAPLPRNTFDQLHAQSGASAAGRETALVHLRWTQRASSASLAGNVVLMHGYHQQMVLAMVIPSIAVLGEEAYTGGCRVQDRDASDLGTNQV